MERVKGGSVYILASRSGVLYIGVTSRLDRRIVVHKQKLIDVFSKKYNVSRVVYYELFGDIRDAIRREKKIALIEQDNPTWDDMAEEWFEKRTASADLPQRHAGHKRRASSSRRAGTRSP